MAFDRSGGTGKRSRDKLKTKEPVRIGRSRQGDLPGPNRPKAEPAEIGHVADKKHEGETMGTRLRQSLLDHGLAESPPRHGRIDNERSQQDTTVTISDSDHGEMNPADQTAIELAA